MIPIVSADELKKMLSNPKTLLIDVREDDEYKAECIAEAKHIALSNISLKNLPRGYDTYIFQCRSGARSHEACRRVLQEAPSLAVFNLEGGIIAWKEAGFTTK